ncbi:MAG: hypothetical protein AAF549_04085 [Pseudomonadota bacterium]
MSSIRTRRSLSEELSRKLGQPIHVTEQDVLDAKELSEGSKEAEKLVMPLARWMARQIGLNSRAACSEADTKRLYRIFEKAVTKYDKVVSKVPDIGRMRLYIEKPEDVIALRRLLFGDNPRYYDDRKGIIQDPNVSNEITLKEVEDFYHVPSKTGRVGLHIQLAVKIPGNKIIPFEIQIIHKDMKETEDFTRENYDEAKTIQRRALLEKRPLTDDEAEAVANYDESSQKRYLADSIKHGLVDLRRFDLRRAASQKAAHFHLAS